MPYKDPEMRKLRKNQRRAENRNEWLKKEAKYRATRREANTVACRKYRYGISKEQYDALLAAQGGVCSICALAGTVKKEKRSLCVDHDHKTGKIRGLLCHAHNFLVGYAHDSLPELSAAYHYLKHHKEKS